MISPDGSQERDLGNPRSSAWAFSKDSKSLFGIRTDGDRAVLYALGLPEGFAPEPGLLSRLRLR